MWEAYEVTTNFYVGAGCSVKTPMGTLVALQRLNVVVNQRLRSISVVVLRGTHWVPPSLGTPPPSWRRGFPATLLLVQYPPLGAPRQESHLETMGEP